MALVALFVLLGALSITAQTALVRELLVLLHGTELVLGAALAAWLGWIAVGAAVGSVMARRARRPRLWLLGWVAVAGTALVAEVPSLRLAPGLLGVDPGSVASVEQGLVLALGATLPFALAVGATFPLGARLLAETSGRTIAGLYAAEAAGSVAGGLLFGLVLAGRVGHTPVLAVGVAAVIAAAAVPAAADARGPALAGATVSAGLVLGVPWLVAADAASQRQQVAALAPGQEVLRVVDTPYQRLALTRLSGQYTVYADGLPGATFPDRYETAALRSRLLVQRPGAARILVLGEAASGLAQALQAGRERGAVTFVSPDPAYTALVAEHLPAGDRAALVDRVRHVVDDPRVFVLRTTDRFDLVFVAAPAPTSIAQNRLFTAEAFAAMRKVLRPGGVVALRLSWASERASPEQRELARSIRAALAAVFRASVMTAADEALVFACDAPGGLTADPGTVAARLAAQPGGAPHAAAIALEYEPGRLRELEAAIAGAGAPPNTDERPSSHAYGTVLWGRYGGGHGTPWLGRLVTAAEGAWRWVVLAVVAATLAGVVRSRRRASSVAIDAAVTVAITGAASMATSIALLVGFQSTCGSLYGRLAIVSALFMAGLALGAVGVGATAGRCEARALVVAVLLAFAGVAASLPELGPATATLGLRGRELVFGLAFAAAGLGLGGIFPAAGQVLVSAAPRSTDAARTSTSLLAARVAARLDTFDHLGACVGALVTGTWALPALGTTTTLRLVAAAAAGAAAIWVVRGRHTR